MFSFVYCQHLTQVLVFEFQITKNDKPKASKLKLKKKYRTVINRIRPFLIGYTTDRSVTVGYGTVAVRLRLSARILFFY